MINERTADAVLFDLDGTVTDTEKFYQKAWREALGHFGWDNDPRIPLELRSLGFPLAEKLLKARFGEDFNFDEVRSYRLTLFEKMIEENGVPVKPGAAEVLKWLREHGILTALVTSSNYGRAKESLDRCGLTQYFDRILSAEMVTNGKPAPDIYLYACSELGMDPGRTIAVEDSPNGVKSAWSAGCRVIMVPDMSEPDEEIMPMLYARVDTLSDIIKLIKTGET